MASRTASAPVPSQRQGPLWVRGPPWSSIWGRCNSIVNRVVRSTSVPIAELFSPSIRSPSQCPGTARSSASPPPRGRRTAIVSTVGETVAALYRTIVAGIRTIAYVERSIAEGLSKREIIRCLKRFLAREIFTGSFPHPAPFRCRRPSAQRSA